MRLLRGNDGPLQVYRLPLVIEIVGSRVDSQRLGVIAFSTM